MAIIQYAGTRVGVSVPEGRHGAVEDTVASFYKPGNSRIVMSNYCADGDVTTFMRGGTRSGYGFVR